MKTLIVVDIQNDFMPDGALGIPNADEIVPVINRLMPKFDHVFATQDWHPINHKSFAHCHGKKVGDVIQMDGIDQILWPEHCVQNTHGADFHPRLDRSLIEAVFQKGVDCHVDSYSAFYDNSRKFSTGLANHLKELNLKDLYFCGLATDYCVLYSVLDGLSLGFNCYLIQDACRAVNLSLEDGTRAIQKMINRGAKVIQSALLI